ncbi:hypothetical protein [Undibacterium sp.]|uniref:hypothetical protein n=1 Tax=Undibacterium sp. TaxID=1914977 RepID=UPI003753A5A7
MAFRLTQKPTFVTRIDVETANAKGGFDSSHFMCEFRRIDMEEHQRLIQEKPVDFLPNVIVGFTELIDDDGQQVEFNEVNLKILLSMPNVVISLKNAFWAAVNKAKEKN